MTNPASPLIPGRRAARDLASTVWVWRSVLLLAAAAVFAAGIFASCSRPGGAPALHKDSELVAATTGGGSVSMLLSDMDDGLALRVADGAGRAIPIARVHASAALLRDGEGIVVMPFSQMNGDHLMVHARNSRAARLVVAATIDGQRFNAPFDLPLPPPSRQLTERVASHGSH